MPWRSRHPSFCGQLVPSRTNRKNNKPSHQSNHRVDEKQGQQEQADHRKEEIALPTHLTSPIGREPSLRVLFITPNSYSPIRSAALAL
jgi:hypothetical protein